MDKMIEVIVKYNVMKRGSYIYKDVIIKGHSSDGTINSIKCCAGVTAITCGLVNYLYDTSCKVDINKGYFHFHSHKYEKDINIAIDAMLYQLDAIQMTYPSYFKEFQFIKEKTNG